ncbi:hypothetical protein POVWA2_035050 [Plasmodium ovale wallikeri]|uniref:Uncharacterized protein n=1 Tax=Plasmodium ovale wallikeri TaxID=864142 RepID=A0A1A8Z2R0_PLAOA|nr:hypothetical protein POVWA1_035790 [Plasmodium ovale wallikeri]SBT38109.1 hypothetical protein POVWA2_035050 [Plasmodium ovale wallikeri]
MNCCNGFQYGALHRGKNGTQYESMCASHVLYVNLWSLFWVITKWIDKKRWFTAVPTVVYRTYDDVICSIHTHVCYF